MMRYLCHPIAAFRAACGIPCTPTQQRRCRQAELLLFDFLDGQLDEADAMCVVEHLEACRRCGLNAAIYREIKESLRRQRHQVAYDVLDRFHTFLMELDAADQPQGERTGPLA